MHLCLNKFVKIIINYIIIYFIIIYYNKNTMSSDSDNDDINIDDYTEYGVLKSEMEFIFPLARMHPSSKSVIFLYHDLNLLVTKLKIEIFSEGKDLPDDILEKILYETLRKEKRKIIELSFDDMNKLIVQHDIFIKDELRNRLTKLGIQYDESDNYVNVVNYAKAKGLNLIYIEDEIISWLGTTDKIYEKYHDNVDDFIWRDKEDRRQKIIATNKRLNGGAKIKIKKSSHNKYRRKINKISKKN
jgi:hypothetical protein